MPYLLGIDIGESTVTAAVCPNTGRPPHGLPAEFATTAQAGWGPAQPVVLGSSGAAVAATLLLSPGGGLVAAGNSAGHGQRAEQASGFVRRVGDDVAVRFADRAVSAQALVAEMVGWTVGRLWQQRGQAPERIAVAHPSDWGPYRLGLLRAALDEAGLGEPALVPRAGAVVTAFEAAGRLPRHGTVLVVFRLDATSLEVSLVSLHPSGQYEFIASLECTDIRGADLDAADTAAQRSILRAGVDLAARTVAACRVQAMDMAAVLLAGGAAGHPMLADLLAITFPVPILLHGDPELTVACGAALSVRPRARPASTAPAPAVPEFTTAQAPAAGPGEPVAPGPQAAFPPPRPPVRVTAAPVGRR